MIEVSVVAATLAVRAGLRALLDVAPEISVVAESASLDEPDSRAAAVDVMVMVAETVDRPALEAVLSDAPAPFALLLISDVPESAGTVAGLPFRAWGLLPLDASSDELVAAVRALHEGLLVGAPPLMAPLLNYRVLVGQGEDSAHDSLSERETEVLGLLAQGLANKQIAGELDISEHTVKFHVSSIYGKLGATNRAEAVRLGARLGLIVL